MPTYIVSQKTDYIPRKLISNGSDLIISQKTDYIPRKLISNGSDLIISTSFGKSLAWVSGVFWEKGNDGSERRRELKSPLP